jgi:hypothetical protein
VEAIWTAVVGVVFAIWFAASVVHQLRPHFWRRAIGRDLPGLLPRWNFFAPRPAHEDTHIVYREQHDGGWSDWRALTPAIGMRRWRWIWNPQRYPRKAAVDLADGLRRSIARFERHPRAILLSNSYVGILQWVMRQPADRGVTHRQFAIVTSRGFGSEQTLDLLFVSEPHSLDV